MTRLVVLVLIALVAAPVGLYCYWIGLAPYGNGYPGGSSEPCVIPEALPAGAELAHRELISEAATIIYSRIPLGFVCRVNLINPTRTKVIKHQSWPATIGWLGSSSIAALSTVVAILSGRRNYRAWSQQFNPS